MRYERRMERRGGEGEGGEKKETRHKRYHMRKDTRKDRWRHERRERTYPTPSIGTAAETHPTFTIVHREIAILTTHSHGIAVTGAIPLSAVGGAIATYSTFAAAADSTRNVRNCV